jgi:hypothetical protein
MVNSPRLILRDAAASLVETAIAVAKTAISDASGVKGADLKSWFDSAGTELSVISRPAA